MLFRSVVGLLLLAGGCAILNPPCEKVEIVVAQKEERSRIEMRRGPGRVTATGSVEETTEPARVNEYYVRSSEGAWHRISEAQFKGVTPQQKLEVCR